MRIIRFPDGSTEVYAGSGRAPSVGDRFFRRDADWIVARVDGREEDHVAVTLMPAEVARDDSRPKPFELVSTTS
jgi:hypothetical protein